MLPNEQSLHLTRMSQLLELQDELLSNCASGESLHFFAERLETGRSLVKFFFGSTTQTITNQLSELNTYISQSLKDGSNLTFLAPFDRNPHAPIVIIQAEKCLEVCFDQAITNDLQQKDLDADFLQNLTQETAKKFTFEEMQKSQSKIEQIQDLQIKGDCYLINFAELLFLHDNNNEHKNTKIFTHRSRQCLAAFLSSNQRFGAFLNSNDNRFGICLSSPEKFVSVDQSDRIETQPIKGTRSLNQQDLDLWQSRKEMREHLMVIDLLRNDLNSVCIAGTVQVNKPYEVVAQNGLLQMQSTVFGQTLPQFDFAKLLPPGSVSGTPKQRCLKILAEHEEHDRGYFAGCTGYVHNHCLQSAINIRSLFWDRRGDYAGAGAGITTLSDAKAEVAEILLKFQRIQSHFVSKKPVFEKINRPIWAASTAATTVFATKAVSKTLGVAKPITLSSQPCILFVDHFDSFSWNIINAFKKNGFKVVIEQSTTIANISQKDLDSFDGVVLSPGPGHPKECVETLEFLALIPFNMPVLGVCLGFQILCYSEGCNVVQVDDRPSHGRSIVSHLKFEKPADIQYSSLLKGAESVVFEWSSDAAWAYFNSWGISISDPNFQKHFAGAGTYQNQYVAAASHLRRPWLLTQFHPDSFASSQGEEFLQAVCMWFQECAKLNTSTV